ncbi:sorbitol operon transcription regulator [Agrilactobacillus composti DSM 18527 = JCM 14202]|uniref:BglG family transcription antiterminator n=1 Tax=Agrilactobacillus composti TaxID=398555 RepID=UPI00042DF654|nr:HTH domain-containing protein [Agrilactobacillus composti]GAF41170.1 sorbitol operon transcription regulator [Agrilactobacillus composti DSM 18527 = JCM 14202]
MEEQNYRLMKAFITNDSLSMTELTAQFHVSNRTMLKRIQDLNDDLQQIAEVRSNQQNFYLKVDDFAQLTKLQTGYLKRQLDFNDPQKRQAFILQRLIKSPTYIILDDLAEELTVSKGTLNKDIKILKKVLPNYQADIVAITNKGIKLTVAHDYNYGLLLTQLIFDYYPGEAPAMSAAQRTQLNQILGDLDEASHTTALINNNLAALAELQGADHRLEGTIPHYQTLLPRAKLAPLVALVNEVLAVQLTPTEIDFLCYPLNLKVLPATDDELLQQRLQWVHQLYQQIQTTVMGTIDIDLNFEHVFDQIRYHLLFMINRLIFKVTSDSILSDEVIEKFPVALELAMSTAKALEAQIGAAVPDTEVNYLAIYYQMEIEDAA